MREKTLMSGGKNTTEKREQPPIGAHKQWLNLMGHNVYC
jgi:hypothetical protein